MAKTAENDDGVIRDIPCFAVGRHRDDGHEYTRASLDEMARNFARFCTGPRPLMIPPVVVGHDEEKNILADTGAPADGWVVGLRRRGDTLYCDLADVSPELRAKVKGKKYRFLSLEVYTPNALPRAVREEGGSGCMARRLAVLGAMPPEVKMRGGDLSEHFSERRRGTRFDRASRLLLRCVRGAAVPLPGGAWACFSEVTEMDRASLLEQLAAKGVDTSAVEDAVPDAVLSEWLRSLDGAGAGAGAEHDAAEAAEAEAGGEKMGEGDDPEAMRGEEAMQGGEGEEGPEKFSFDEPEDEDGAIRTHAWARQAMDHGERCLKKYSERKGSKAAKYAEAESTYTQGLVDPQIGQTTGKPKRVDDGEAEAHSERAIAARIDRAVKDALTRHGGRLLADVEKHSERIRRHSSEAAIDKLVASGKVSPGERDRAVRIHAGLSPAVEKFSERGREVSVSPQDDYLASLAKRPSLFRELAGTGGQHADDQVAEIEGHYEQFSEQFGRVGTTREDFVRHYEDARKLDPRLTAQTHLLRMAGRRA